MPLKKFFGKKSGDDWDYEDDIIGGSADDFGPPIPEVDDKDQEILRGITIRVRAYADYNKRKVNTILSKLNDLDKQIFMMLPALVHLNLPGLPGYVDDPNKAPDGIIGYQPPDDLPRRIERLIPGATINIRDFKRSRGESPIYSLAAMGSLATIAQTSKSDFDMWVCVRKPEFTQERLEGLAYKLEEIERWTERTNRFESHFFITDIDEARNNTFGESDSESAGSALGKLLKEEFFRTHTVFAGAPPLWTVMPPHMSDEEYDRVAQLAFSHHTIAEKDYIDLGNAQRISMEEAFGAVLWQLNKALGSPFKSAMKMGLIEDYIDTRSASTLLCDDLKQTITGLASREERDRTEFDTLGHGELIDEHPNRFDLDGYLLMFNRILDYYKRMDRGDLQEILRQCFYLKAGDTISGIHDPLRAKYRKKDMLAELIEGWGWGNDHILNLNNFKEWPFDRSVKLGGQVNNFIIDSYKRLSQTGATSKAMINETDLTVLGRKLFTFYSRKEKKVDYLPRTFEESLHQAQITFAMTPSRTGGENLWKVYRGSVSQADLQKDKTEEQLLRQTRNLPDLLVWLVMNGVWDRRTQVNLQSRESRLTAAILQDILESLGGFFPPIDVGHLPNEHLIKNAEVRRLYAIVNLGDAGEMQGIRRIDLIYRTSWGEIYTERPTGKINTLNAVRFCLDRLPYADKGKVPALKVYVPSGKTGVAAGRKIFTDFEEGLQGIANFFHSTPLPPLTQRTFLFKGENGVIAASWNGKETNTAQYGTFEEFFQKRESGRLFRSEIEMAHSATEMIGQQAIVKKIELNVIQVFMQDDGIRARVYISDEMGSTMYTNMVKTAWPTYAVKLGVFLSNIANKIMAEPWRVKAKLPPIKLAFYHVEAGETNPNLLEVHEYTMKYLQAIENKKSEAGQVSFAEMKTKDGKRALVFQVDEEKITSLKHGNNVFQAVAAHIRKLGKRGGISIANLSLPPDFRTKNCPRGAKTYHFLAYKNFLDHKLGEALKSLS
ncbi:class I adenylate cyclase [Nitrospinota bacterium]